jgi:hypothetical protein
MGAFFLTLMFTLAGPATVIAWAAFVLFSDRGARLFPAWRTRAAAVWAPALIWGAASFASFWLAP